MVSARLQGWLKEVVSGNGCISGQTLVAVTHKGVIRAALHLATGWTMEKSFKPKIDWQYPVCFSLDSNGALRLTHTNKPYTGLSA